jgi:hypothetical protein
MQAIWNTIIMAIKNVLNPQVIHLVVINLEIIHLLGSFQAPTCRNSYAYPCGSYPLGT